MSAPGQLRLLQRRINAVAEAAGPFWHQGDGHGGAVMDALATACAERGLSMPDLRIPMRPVVQRLAKRDGWSCRYCGCPLGWGHPVVSAPEVEHLTPRARGGSDDLANLGLSCNPCNADKGTMTEAEYLLALTDRDRAATA